MYLLYNCIETGVFMDHNQEYIRNLTIEDVPWHRLDTAYARATHFPAAFQILNAMEDKDAVSSAIWEIRSIEHQSTLFYAAPFAMIFLTRIFQKAVEQYDKNEIANYLVSKLLACFHDIAFACKYAENYTHEKPLANFSDMLDEKYLCPVLSDEQLRDPYFEEAYEYPDVLFYSFYFYSYKILLEVKESIVKIKDESLSDGIEQLLMLLSLPHVK